MTISTSNKIKKGKTRYHIVFLLCIIGINIFLNKFKSSSSDEEYIFWANLNYWLFAFPMFKFLYNDYQHEIFPFMGTTGIFLSFAFSFPVFFVSPENYQLGYFNVMTLEVSFWSYLHAL